MSLTFLYGLSYSYTSEVFGAGLVFVVKVGRKRVITIPKAAAEEVGLVEGGKVKITVEGGRLILEPIRDAIWLSMYGEKVARVTFEELEAVSIEEQEKYIGGRRT